jgi:uncharacterized protein YjiK
MNELSSLLSLLLVGVLLGSCGAGASTGDQGQEVEKRSQPISTREAIPEYEDTFPYRLTQPDQTYELPSVLEEASAVCMTPEGELALVQDEKATIFLFSETEKKVVSRHVFGGNGDFEGLSIIGDTAYALMSNGSLFVIPDYRQEKPAASIVRTFLTQEEDTEGLTLDPETGNLLVACKEPPLLASKRAKDKRGIYQFSLSTQRLQQQPFLVLDMYQVKEIFQQQARTKKEIKRATEFEAAKKGSFKPADLAIHPQTGNLYIVAANGQLLVVVQRDGKVLYVRYLPKKIFGQPEGICFDPQGTLYICNEAKDGPANILRFAYQPQ